MKVYFLAAFDADDAVYASFGTSLIREVFPREGCCVVALDGCHSCYPVEI